jgi:hypothetical protein
MKLIPKVSIINIAIQPYLLFMALKPYFDFIAVHIYNENISGINGVA